VSIDAGLLAKLDALPDAKPGSRGVQWTPEMDSILKRYWPTKRQTDVAAAIGVHVNTCRRRVEELGIK
jgi:hypothetical protein